ncbi:adhesion G-protein coupled receptor G1 isoform X2 [Carassius gibelio]|uniref:adhesion G-protein coupled receptor G1 isoform X2 n=1 Tax=Carassius gibelio TaxID=101364 RepID=UPI0022777D85|nr:adhesion G-protein coupled receptor G1 isoform X2 [Carassius gibelio]
MRGLYYFVLWIFPIFPSTIQNEIPVPCYKVPQTCMKKANVLSCIEEGMRTCLLKAPRILIPNFFSIAVSSEGMVDTGRGYKIHVSEEALERSSSRREETSKEVELIVSILNETLFQKGNDSNESRSILHGQSVLGVWLGLTEIRNLSQPIQLRFINTNQSANGVCVYWHLDKNGKGNWSTDGCNTIIDGGEFVCSCNHLSFFAVLITRCALPEESELQRGGARRSPLHRLVRFSLFDRQMKRSY